jgi:putative glycerol-1-phosphate prenyltransferase
MLYDLILERHNKEKSMVLLIDPDKHDDESLKRTVDIANRAGINFFLIGGSIISKSINDKIVTIKHNSQLPVFLFPGNLLQLCDKADGILFLSLISGRNPEFLIGNHVLAAPFLKNSKMEVIPTSYILIDTGQPTSVEYMSNTSPIPANKPEIAVATALAGEMLGHKLVYLEGGSGAGHTVNVKLIQEVKRNISIPLIVGGGIRTTKQASEIFDAGADIIVIGNVAEENPLVMFDLISSADPKAKTKLIFNKS